MLKRIRSLCNIILGWFKTINGKKLIILASVVFLIAVPSFIALSNAIYYEFWYSPDKSVITLYDPSGKQLNTKEDEELSESISKIFDGISSGKTPMKKIPENIGERYHIKAVIRTDSSYDEADYYFSIDDSPAYLVYKTGAIFKIPQTYNSAFLKTPYAEAFFPNSEVVKLLSPELDVVVPSSVSWNYKNSAGKYTNAIDNTTTSDILTYETTAPLKFGFEDPPNECSVKVYDNDTMIYQGNLFDLASLSVDVGSTLRISINAEWNMTNQRDYHGKSSYDFNIKVIDTFDFSVNTETIRAGEFFILYCNNISDPSKIHFESNRIGFLPNFQKYGDSTIAIIHFPESTTLDHFDFTVSSGSVSRSFSIGINKSNITKEFISNDLVFVTSDQPIKRNEFIQSTITSMPLSENDTVYFHGNFTDPTSRGFELAYSHQSVMKWSTNSKNAYTTFGNEYIIPEGSDVIAVPAIQNGVVVKIGNDTNLGRYVVVDHGCGLRSWYANLGSTDVEIGDIVLNGQSVGKIGKGSFKSAKGFALYCTVQKDVINPVAVLNIK